MKKLIFVLFATLAGLSAFAQVDRSTPEKTIRSLGKAVETANLKAALSCVKGSKSSDSVKQLFQEIAQHGPDVQIKIQVDQVKISGDTATAQATTTMIEGGRTAPTDSETVKLVKVGNDWMIVAPKTYPKMHETFINVCAFDLTNGIPPPLPQISAKKAQCISNLKSIAAACLVFAADKNDVFRFDSKNWVQAIQPYLTNMDIFTCPLNPKGTISYSINPEIAGKSTVAIGSPAETVLVYEGRDGNLNIRHDGTAVVAFCDGHVMAIDKEKAKKLRWKP
jgi:prepilin-type processing-associated H-X9-DG protein